MARLQERRIGLVRSILVAAALTAAAPAWAQVDPRTALLERGGWDAIAAGQTAVAVEAFRQAIAADPTNARLLTRARALMGQVLHRTGDLPGAIRMLETVTAAAPGDTAAQATLDRWRRELDLQQRMQLAVGDHFAVSFEGPAEQALADKAIESLERAYARICAVLNTYPTATVPVVLYTAQQFTDITRSPSWAAAAYDGTIRVPMRGALADERELDRVLAHEFTHALVYTLSARAIPTWLNEGLATALESEDLDRAERRAGQSTPVPLAALRGSFGRFSGAQAQVAYATSALAVRRMLQDAGGFAVANLVRDLGEGVDFDTAFAHRIQRTFDEFQAALAAP
jgi:Tetratricopeptide repeat